MRVTPPANIKVGVAEWDRLMAQLRLDMPVLHDAAIPHTDHGLLQRAQDQACLPVRCGGAGQVTLADCALDRAGLHAIACKRMHTYRYVLHNQLCDLWKRKGVEAGGIATIEPCTDDVLANQFGPAIRIYAMLSRKLPLRLPNKRRLRFMSSSNPGIKQATKPSSNRNALIQEINRLAASASVKQKGLRVDVLVKLKRLKDVWIDQVYYVHTQSIRPSAAQS